MPWAAGVVGRPWAAGVVDRPGAAAGAPMTVADDPSLLAAGVVRARLPEDSNKQSTRQYGKRFGKLETMLNYMRKTLNT